MSAKDVLAVKIGGSTLGEHDTTLDDLVALQREGRPVVVVHGGGNIITQWLNVHGVAAHFVRGLRVTDDQALPVVVAVLAGLINKELVAALNVRGGRAVGISGADGVICARPADPALGHVGEVERLDPGPINALLAQGYLVVVAPLGFRADGQGPQSGILNINGDTAAAAAALAVSARSLVFLTDVPGVLNSQDEVIPHLSGREAKALLDQGVVKGGMIPKVEAGVKAAAAGAQVLIVDGRQPHALLASVRGEPVGTRIG